jgi:hypothetical protein
MVNFPTKPTLSDVQHWKFRPSQSMTVTTTAQVKATDGMLNGFFVSAGTPTVTIYNISSGTTGAILIEPVVTAVAGNYQFGDIYFSAGCYVSLTNAGTVQVFYK